MSEKDEPTTESCLLLMSAIIDKAIKDLQILAYLDAVADSTSASAKKRAYAKKRARKINCCSPAEFFKGAWFEEICVYLELGVDAVRAELGGERGIAA